MSAQPDRKVYYVHGIPFLEENVVEVDASHEDLGHAPLTAAPVAAAAAKFQLGQCYTTPGAQAWLAQYQIDPQELLRRHQTGDHGDLEEEDRETNIVSGYDGGQVLSQYRQGADPIMIITDAGHETTTLLIFDEY